MGEREKDAKRIRESLLIPIPRVLSEPRAVLSALCFHGSNNPLGGRYCCSHFTDEKTETFHLSTALCPSESDRWETENRGE